MVTSDPFRRQLAERAAALLLGDLPLPEEALLAFADALHDLETAVVARHPAGGWAEYLHCAEREGETRS